MSRNNKGGRRLTVQEVLDGLDDSSGSEFNDDSSDNDSDSQNESESDDQSGFQSELDPLESDYQNDNDSDDNFHPPPDMSCDSDDTETDLVTGRVRNRARPIMNRPRIQSRSRSRSPVVARGCGQGNVCGRRRGRGRGGIGARNASNYTTLGLNMTIYKQKKRQNFV